MAQEVSLFVKEVKSRAEGDSVESIALKNEKKAIVAWKRNIGGIEDELLSKKDDLETAKENLGNAIYPTALIQDSKTYCEGIAQAQWRVNVLDAEIENLETDLQFFNDLLKKHSSL